MSRHYPVFFNEPPYWIEITNYGMWIVGFNDGEWWEIGCVKTLKMARKLIIEHKVKLLKPRVMEGLF